MILRYVVSEAPTNSAGHAQASVVQLELESPDGIVRLAICDEGVAGREDGVAGTDLAPGSELVGLRDRIEALGGTLELTNPTGSGTTLLIEIPVESQSSRLAPEP